MPLSERDYPGGYSNRFPQGVKWLIVANTAIWLVSILLELFGFSSVLNPFRLVPIQVATSFYIWQPVTYLFLHAVETPWHLLFNMLMLWMFGADVERAWGTIKFLQFYLVCGVGAGLCVVLANLLFGNPYLATIGASGAIFGLLLAFGMLFPDRSVLFLMLFPLKAKYMVMIMGALEMYNVMHFIGGPVSNVAHLGGMAIGYFYIRKQRRKSPHSRPRGNTSFWGNVKGQYEEWRLQRARRKFQVYLKKRQDQDPYVH
ncbi:MAG: rhomboid family intramembrane serine protease [Bryobacteraceae bacterium]|nr:rhomboid family intramembrane serine protease [Bryobacteraceae bacterium]